MSKHWTPGTGWQFVTTKHMQEWRLDLFESSTRGMSAVSGEDDLVGHWRLRLAFSSMSAPHHNRQKVELALLDADNTCVASFVLPTVSAAVAITEKLRSVGERFADIR